MDNLPISSQNANIMVVDDFPANLRALTRILTAQGYRVQAVQDSRLALSTAKAVPLDLILLDIRMPNLDGYEVCAQLKADAHTRDIPVLFVSALGDVFNKVKAFSLGAVDFITKPFEVAEVLARVNTHLTIRHLHQRLQEQNKRLEQAYADLTRHSADLEEANASLRASNAELDAFAHTVAHDLKNPLSALIGFASLLNEDLDELDLTQPLELVYQIQEIGEKMTNIIRELLLLASVRKGEVEPGPLDLAGIIDQVQRRLRMMIEEYHGQIFLPATWPAAWGYAPWIEEVWTNYISNGLKYGGQPPRLQLGATTQNDGMVRFWVKDHGNGLTPAEQSLLFAEFTRLDGVRAEGHGLGLSIVRRIVDKLGGQVGVESQVGQGSTFYFTLPQVAGNCGKSP